MGLGGQPTPPRDKWGLRFDPNEFNEGTDYNRTTGATYTFTEVFATFYRDIRLRKVLWDLGAASTYTVTIDGIRFGEPRTNSTRTPDVAFEDDRILGRGVHAIRLSPATNKNLDDRNATGFAGNYFAWSGAWYGGSYFSTLTAALRLVGQPGDWSRLP